MLTPIYPLRLSASIISLPKLTVLYWIKICKISRVFPWGHSVHPTLLHWRVTMYPDLAKLWSFSAISNIALPSIPLQNQGISKTTVKFGNSLEGLTEFTACYCNNTVNDYRERIQMKNIAKGCISRAGSEKAPNVRVLLCSDPLPSQCRCVTRCRERHLSSESRVFTKTSIHRHDRLSDYPRRWT